MKRREFLGTMAAVAAAATAGAALPGCATSKARGPSGRIAAKDLLSTPSERGSPGFHHHLTLPGEMTSYILQVSNYGEEPCDVSLSLDDSKAEGWDVTLDTQRIERLEPGTFRDVMLEVKPGKGRTKGDTATVSVKAQTDSGMKDSAEVVAEVSDRPKILFVSIDSLHPDYLKLDSHGTGPGKPGDWLMPNLHRILEQGTFYPNHEVHIITATDMNHFNFLAGTMTGTSGIPFVGGTFFGFDEKKRPVFGYAPLDLNFYGPEGRRVRTLYNAAKDHNPNAWNCFISGKNWVPDMMRAPEQQIDLHVNGEDVPGYIAKMEPATPKGAALLGRLLAAGLLGTRPHRGYPMGNPARLEEPQDPRSNRSLARLMGAMPNHFPSDQWVMDASLRIIENEDPDVMYILLAAVDDAGHAFGSAFDLEEWDEKGSEDMADHVSCYNLEASRQGILNVVREADRQLGRLVETLAERGTLDSTTLIVESDHSMITYYKEGLDMRRQLEKHCPCSPKDDYFFGAGGSNGSVYLRRNDPDVLNSVEQALEAWRVTNPKTGKSECPVYVFNREEMRSGTDRTGESPDMLPGEYFSEYFIEHRKDGEQWWPDLLVLTKPHYEFKVQNFGLGNVGMKKTGFDLPEYGYFTGGHGSFATRPALLVMRGPGIPGGVVRQEKVFCSDVAPAIYTLMGWPVPDCVDGKGLPGIAGTDKDTG